MTETTALSPIDALRGELAELLESAESLTITTETEYAASAELTKAARVALAKAKEGLTKDLAPVVAEEKMIRDRWRPLQQQAEKAKALVDAALMAYQREQRRLAAERFRR